MTVTPLARTGSRAPAVPALPAPAPLRIAMIAPPWLPVPPPGYGGTERVIALLADGLVERGHDVTLFAAPGSQTRARLVTPLAACPPYINSAPDDDILHTLCAYTDALLPGDVDLIHDHTALGPAMVALRDTGPPVVHTLHGPWTDAVRGKLALCDHRVHLVAISEAQRSANPDVRYTGVVPNGVDLVAHPFRAAKEPFCIFVGRSSPAKGPEIAIDVARAAGLPLIMVVKRAEPEEWAHWSAVVAPKLGPDVTVFEQPPHAVKVGLLGRARAALCPITWAEPFGLVFTEALACGTPVVTRPFGAASEIVEHGVSGFLCDSVDEMAAAVHAAARLRPEDCRRRAEERFSGASMVAGYEQVYASVLAATGERASLTTAS